MVTERLLVSWWKGKGFLPVTDSGGTNAHYCVPGVGSDPVYTCPQECPDLCKKEAQAGRTGARGLNLAKKRCLRIHIIGKLSQTQRALGDTNATLSLWHKERGGGFFEGYTGLCKWVRQGARSLGPLSSTISADFPKPEIEDKDQNFLPFTVKLLNLGTIGMEILKMRKRIEPGR